jgi:membrane-associated phospholipid phosphatase
MTEQKQSPYSSINKWFLYPFLAWVILGGIAVLAYEEEILFAMVNTHHSSFLDPIMVLITRMGEGVFGTIILLLLVALRGFRNWWYFTAAILCNVVPALLTQAIKSWVDAPRPLNRYKGASWIHHLPEWETLLNRSFPSGHTCAAFCLFTFLAFVLTPKYKAFGAVFFLLALLVGYSRIYLAAHFFLDVYIGSIIGVVFTILVVLLMKRYNHYFFFNRNRI